MEIKNVKAFVRYGVDEKMTQSKVMSGSVIISLIAAVMGFIGICRQIWVSPIIIFMGGITYVIWASGLSKNLTPNKRVKCTALNTVAAALLFSLCCQVFVEMCSIQYGFLLTLSPLVLGAVSFLISFIKCQMNLYIDKKNNPKYMNLASFAALGVAASGLLLEDLPMFENLPAEITLAICFCLLANAFSMVGAPSLLKVYYIKKFHL